MKTRCCKELNVSNYTEIFIIITRDRRAEARVTSSSNLIKTNRAIILKSYKFQVVPIPPPSKSKFGFVPSMLVFNFKYFTCFHCEKRFICSRLDTQFGRTFEDRGYQRFAHRPLRYRAVLHMFQPDQRGIWKCQREHHQREDLQHLYDVNRRYSHLHNLYMSKAHRMSSQ